MKIKAKPVSGKAVLVGVIVCGVLAGCGGASSDQGETEVRSLLDELDVVQIDLPSNEESTIPEESVTKPVADAGSADPNTRRFSWTPAHYFEDGSIMGAHEIHHYKVMYGTSPDALTESSEVSLGSLRTFELQAETGTTWYAAVKTVSVYGSESEVSNTVSLIF